MAIKSERFFQIVTSKQLFNQLIFYVLKSRKHVNAIMLNS